MNFHIIKQYTSSILRILLKNENKSCLNELKFWEVSPNCKIKNLMKITAVYLMRNLKTSQDNTITVIWSFWNALQTKRFTSWKVDGSGISSYFLPTLLENCHFGAKDQNYSIFNFSLNIDISYQARSDGNSPTKEERMNQKRIFFQQYWLQRIVEAEIEASVDENANRRGQKASIESFDTITFHCFNVYIYDAIELAFSRSTFGVCG